MAQISFKTSSRYVISGSLWELLTYPLWQLLHMDLQQRAELSVVLQLTPGWKGSQGRKTLLCSHPSKMVLEDTLPRWQCKALSSLRAHVQMWHERGIHAPYHTSQLEDSPTPAPREAPLLHKQQITTRSFPINKPRTVRLTKPELASPAGPCISTSCTILGLRTSVVPRKKKRKSLLNVSSTGASMFWNQPFTSGCREISTPIARQLPSCIARWPFQISQVLQCMLLPM